MKEKNRSAEFAAYKTERQWALEGKLPKEENTGIELWSNRNHNKSYIYYSPDEVVEANPSDLKLFFCEREGKKKEDCSQEKERGRRIDAD